MASAGQDTSIDIGNVVSIGFRAIGENALAFAAVSLLVVGLPAILLSSLLDPATEEFGAFSLVIFLGSMAVAMIGGAFLQVIVVRSTLLSVSGRSAEIGASVALAFRLLLPMIGLSLLTWFLIVVGLTLLIVPGLIILTMLIVAVPALVEQHGGVIASMKRSRELTKGSRWKVFLLIVLFFIAWAIISAGATFVMDAAGLGAGIGGMIFGLLFSAAQAVIIAALLAGLYLELRTAKEGATLEGLAAIFE